MADLLSIDQFMGGGPAASPAAPSSGLMDIQTFMGTPSVVPAPKPEGNNSAMLGELEKSGYQPTMLDRGLEAVNDFTDQAKRAASFGLTDKISAAVPAINQFVKEHILGEGPSPQEIVANNGQLPSVSDTYHHELANQRQMGETYAENHPVASKVATTLGTVGSVGASAGEAIPATLLGKVAQGVKGGATIGGISGFGGSNDESSAATAIDTGEGVVSGAGLGAALPVALKGAQPAVEAIARKIGPNATENQAVRAIADRITQDTKAGGPTATAMLEQLNAAPGKPQTLADVSGENVRSLAGNVARQPGPARQQVTQFLNERDKAAGTRLAGDVNQHISNGQSAFQTAQALTEGRSKAAAPLYEQAFAANQNIQSPVIDRILKTPAGQKALAAARVKMQNDLSLMGTPDKDLMEQAREAGQKIPGGKGVASGLKLRTLDYVKRAFDDMIGTSLKAGENDNARILIARKNQLVKALDDADVTGKAGPNSLKPEGGLYAQARAAYSGPSQSLSAVEEGQKIFSKSPEQIEAEIDDLSPGDKEFYKLGAADAIKQRVAKTGMSGNEAKTLVNTDWAQRQIRPLFDSDEAYERFMNAATAENRMFQTRYDLLGNSRTAARVAEDAAGHHGAGANAMQMAIDAASGNPAGAFYAGARTLGSLLKRRGGNPEVNAAIGRLLTTPGPDANRQILARILAAQQAPSRLPLAVVPTASIGARLLPQALRGGLAQIPYLSQPGGNNPP